MKKVISYCLFGDKLKYCHGIIESVISSNIIFLDWEVRVYYSIGKQKVPQKVINILNNLNCKLIPFKETNSCDGEDIEGMMWRFTPLGENDVDYWISRDADSRASYREKKMIDEWISSNKTLHTILDHPCHSNFMGGLFGINNKLLREKYPSKVINMNKYIPDLANKQNIRRGFDQKWINKHLLDIAKDKKDVLVHLNSGEACLKKCHISNIKPITNNFETILIDQNFNFTGKQINYFPSKLRRPFIEIEDLNLID